jgi:3-hydroxyisobutyrate dehydrogenase-like beta-hydroxyacid dehydrogenase
MKIAVVGLGYVGLPLAIQFARANVTVLGTRETLWPAYPVRPEKRGKHRSLYSRYNIARFF